MVASRMFPRGKDTRTLVFDNSNNILAGDLFTGPQAGLKPLQQQLEVSKVKHVLLREFTGQRAGSRSCNGAYVPVHTLVGVIKNVV